MRLHSEAIEQGRLAVVDVSHYSHDGRSLTVILAIVLLIMLNKLYFLVQFHANELYSFRRKNLEFVRDDLICGGFKDV